MSSTFPMGGLLAQLRPVLNKKASDSRVYPLTVQITIDIPDSLAAQYLPPGKDAARAVMEDALVQAYREERISGRQLMEALGIPTRYDLDGFLKARQVWINYTPEELEQERLVSQALRESRTAQLQG